jgi:hypothetical protein
MHDKQTLLCKLGTTKFDISFCHFFSVHFDVALCQDVNSDIRKRKFGWIGHTLRKDDGEIPKAAVQWKPQGSRKSGRGKNGWRRSVIKEVGRSWNELRFLALDRSGKNL